MNDAHGDIDFKLDKNIVCVTLIGPFNGAGVVEWTQKLQQIIIGFEGKPFFVLMNNTDYEGFTPEAFQIADDFNFWLNDQTMVVKAIIQPSLLAKEMNIKNIPALAGQRIEYFDNKHDAISWLRTLPEYLNYLD
jgi:hypothetical protein